MITREEARSRAPSASSPHVDDVAVLQQREIFRGSSDPARLTRYGAGGLAEPMDKLASWPRIFARALIVGLLAWCLAAPASAASRGKGLVSANAGLCGADGDGPRHSPDRHALCIDCIACRSGPSDGFSDAPALLSPDTTTSFAASEDDRAESFFAVFLATAPPGWIGSWSQRAPPPRRS
jgi:hypothetical protein